MLLNIKLAVLSTVLWLLVTTLEVCFIIIQILLFILPFLHLCCHYPKLCISLPRPTPVFSTSVARLPCGGFPNRGLALMSLGWQHSYWETCRDWRVCVSLSDCGFDYEWDYAREKFYVVRNLHTCLLYNGTITAYGSDERSINHIRSHPVIYHLGGCLHAPTCMPVVECPEYAS